MPSRWLRRITRAPITWQRWPGCSGDPPDFGTSAARGNTQPVATILEWLAGYCATINAANGA
ncbi:MAG: hypothetical protein LC808_22830 [Actinobacteria bacterium]|nr:hypothetical protein [Actinomycetota bacterium]